ncbi:MAG: glycosyltransferase [Luteitalea sp.]|nr:glycosyltransferase [Luteitalea sp.]
MKHVGIYRSVYPVPSETFITQQAAHLRTYTPTFLVRRRRGETRFPTFAISDGDVYKLKQTFHTLTRSPRLFAAVGSERYDLLHAHFAVDGVYALPLAARLNIPLVVSVHGYEITSHRRPSWRKGSQTKFQFVQYMLHERALKAQATAFIAISEYIKRRLLERGYPEEKIHVHYIGVDLDYFTPASRSARDARYVLCVGRHSEKKGIDTLLEAWAVVAQRHPSVSLIQVGAGPLTERVHQLAHEFGVEKQTRFLGVQPHEEVLRLMRHAEVFCLPSRTAVTGDCEGLGIVFNEASACAVPVVATRHGGIPEAVMDRETGLLVPEGDAPALAQALDAVLADRALGERLGRRGREYVCERFDVRRQGAKLEALYDAAVAQ